MFCYRKIQVIAVGIAVGVGLHAISHLSCDFPRLLHATPEEYEPMKPYFGVEQPSSYWWFVKGVEGVTGIIMVVLMAIAFTLATPWFRRDKINLPKALKKFTGFNAFWYSHHLFIIVYTLLIVHGIDLYLSKKWYQKTVSNYFFPFFFSLYFVACSSPFLFYRLRFDIVAIISCLQTWMYLAVPVSLYVCERLVRAFRSSIKPVKILKVINFQPFVFFPKTILTGSIVLY